MIWCEIFNMWCSDIDEEYREYNACCDEDCRSCDFRIEVNNENRI